MSRRALTFFLFAAALLSFLALSPGPARAAERGDVDCSGTTTGMDALQILTAMSQSPQTVAHNCIAVGEPVAGAINGDANCDGEIDVPDVTATLQLVAGLPVAPCYSAALASSQPITGVVGPAGGTLFKTGPDGSTFTLDVPANALTGEQLIQMSALASISGLPFSGGFVAGVDLQPAGLLFWTPVTLTITPAQSVSLDQETAFEISRGVLSLAPVLPQSGAVKISLNHFTTAGVASGSSSERLAITGDTPASKYENEIARITHDERQNGADPQPLTAEADAFYNAEIAPKLQRAASDCAFGRTFLPKALAGARQLSVLGAGDSYVTQITSVMQAYVDNLVSCYNDAATRCQEHDLSGVPDMLTYERMLSVLGAGSLVDETKPEKCAHFRLEFDSELCMSFVHVNLGACPNARDVQFAATGIEWGGIGGTQPEGQGPLSLIKAVHPNGSATSSGSTFQVASGGVYLNQIDPAGQPVDAQVSIVIQPGKPIEHWTGGSGGFDASYWYDRFCAIHTSELVGHTNVGILGCTTGDLGAGNAQYKISGWQKLGGELYAQKFYVRTYAGIATAGSGAEPQGVAPPDGWEVTTLKLYHEPQ